MRPQDQELILELAANKFARTLALNTTYTQVLKKEELIGKLLQHFINY